MKREELLVNAKPILFNTEMVKAILENRKTVTRRVIKLDLGLADTDKGDSSYLSVPDEYGDHHDVKDLCRYQVGDILYIRETWKPHDYTLIDGVWSCSIEYKVGESLTRVFWKDGEDSIYENTNWKPSIHMPKEAARIFLKVTGVRVERLQDMNIDDIEKEGVYCDSQHDKVQGLLLKFIRLWDSTINKQDFEKYEWYADPYVWVIEFEKINLEDNHNN